MVPPRRDRRHPGQPEAILRNFGGQGATFLSNCFARGGCLRRTGVGLVGTSAATAEEKNVSAASEGKRVLSATCHSYHPEVLQTLHNSGRKLRERRRRHRNRSVAYQRGLLSKRVYIAKEKITVEPCHLLETGRFRSNRDISPTYSINYFIPSHAHILNGSGYSLSTPFPL